MLLCCSVAASAQDPALLKKAQDGDAVAQYELAEFYLPNNSAVSEEGIKWLTKAAENGHLKAQDRLYSIYFYRYEFIDKNEENCKKYVYWLTLVANTTIDNNVDPKIKEMVYGAQMSLGQLYRNGDCGVYKSISKFLQYEKKAVFNGISYAASYLGDYYAEDVDDKQDAIYWYKKFMDMWWAEYQEENELGFQKLRELGVSYHPADHVGHNHDASAASSSTPATTPQGQGGQSVQTVPVQVWQACGGCNGSGQCQVCFGSGWILNYNGNKRLCTACHGNGRCTSCAGQGGHNVVQLQTVVR